MSVYLRYILVLIVELCMSQVIRQQSFSGNGTSLAYAFYFNVYQSQSVILSYSTNCPHMQILWINSGGSTMCSHCALGYGNGGTYSVSCTLGVGTGQKLLLQEWSGRSSCSWRYNFQLNFSCSVVTSNCFDCSSYTTCTSCKSNYYLYNNRCYAYPSYCLSVSGTSCTSCSAGYILMSGACQSCAALIVDCVTCTSSTVCTTCKTGYALTPANQCEPCSYFVSYCTACSNNSTCTGCSSGYALKNATTCQSCSPTLTNCLTCSSITQCTSCSVVGYAVATVGGCAPCSTFKSNCVLCSSNSTCTQCADGYSAEPTGCVLCTTLIQYCSICNFAAGPSCLKCQLGYGLDTSTPASDCIPCSGITSQCVQCLDDQNCTKCASGYTTYLNTSSVRYKCKSCSSFLSQCLTCNSQTSCTTCTPPYTPASSGQCLLCSQVLSGCNTCSNRFACTTCVTGYGLNSNYQCAQCSTVMRNCTKCTTISNCIQCNSGYLPSAGTCKACSIFLPDCLNCTNQTTCTGCDFGYALDSTLGCKFCSILIPHCSYCIDNVTCHTCQPGYVLFNGLCETCDVVFSNCNTCVNNISCSVCDRGYAVVLGRCIPCLNLINHCKNCFDSSNCEECYDPYQPDLNFKCRCKSPLYNVSDFCIDDRQCVNAYKQNDIVYCSFCNISNLYILNQNKKCVCITGYEQINLVCKEKCGDGYIIKQACDDNNTQDGDGCSSTCQVESDFVCSLTPSGMSICKLLKDLQLKLDSVWKILPENKGLIYISLESTDPRLIKFYLSSRFKFTVKSNRTQTIKILNYSRNQDGQIVIEIQYNETIESSMIELEFMFDKDFITSNDDFLKFNLKGSNYPLIISAYNENYYQMSKLLYYFVLCCYALMLLVLFSDKFIGVEALNTLQLVYFSMLLIYNSDNWPQSFSTLLNLHYSTGLSRIFYQQLNYFNTNNFTFSKYQYLGICEYFFLNNLTNFAILFVTSIIFLILFLIKTKKENQIFDMNDCPLKRRLRRKLGRFRKIFRKIYNFTFNFSYTMILQVFISLYIEASYMKEISTWMKVANKLTAIWTLTVMVVTILQNYNHFFLSSQDTIVEKYDVGSRELKYKRVYFIYILLNTWCIIMLNNKLILGYSLSGVLLISSLIYLVYLVLYRPYKYSFLIHEVTIIINHLMFVVILTTVTLINLELKFNEFYFLILSYTLMGFTFIIIFLTVVRVIIDFKYDTNNVTQQIKIQVEKNRRVEEKLFAQQITKQIAQKEESQEKKIHKDRQNSYLYDNQKVQTEQIQFLDQLKKKFFLSQWQRDQAYYQVYQKKPIKWVQKNQNDDKFKLLMEKERELYKRDLESKQMTKLKKQKVLDKTYADQMLNIKERLRGQFAGRKQKKVLKKQVNRSKNKRQTQKDAFNQI